MRRAIVLLTVTACALVVAPAAPAGPLDVKQQHLAWADFAGRRLGPNRWEWFGADVFDSVGTLGESMRFGGIFRGICERHRKDDGVVIKCRGHSGGGLDRHDEFSMDALAASATLEVRDRRWRQRVDWTATPDGPGTYQAESFCPHGMGEGGGIAREAEADAVLYGRHFHSDSTFPNFDVLLSGDMVTQCDILSRRDFTDLTDGGGFTVHRTIRLPSRNR